MGRLAKIVTSSGTVANMYSWSMTVANDLVTQSVFDDDGWDKVHGSAVKSYSGSMEGLMDKDDTNGQVYLDTAALAGTGLTDVWLYVNATDYYKPDTASNDEAVMYIGNVETTVVTEDVIRITFDYQGSGPIIFVQP